MNNNSARDLLISFSLINDTSYIDNPIFNPKVDECLMNMYFYLLYSNVNEEKKTEYFNEFEISYNKLNDDEKEIVRKDWLDIIKSKEKNKRKVKKKGMINYE